ncbi:MAG: hypothetical protein V3U89_01680 [Methylophilaceae bacterium]
MLMFLLALLLANTVRANLDDLNLLHQTADTQESMIWPMLPNESLAQLAAKFYPKNKSMQRKFIRKTKRLNKASLSANSRYKKLTAITIPNLQSLSVQTGVIKRARNKPFRLSYNIKSKAEKVELTIRSIPERLVKQYEQLIARNSFLKVEIAKLHKRLVFLENKLGQLKLIFDRSLTLPPKKKLKNLDIDIDLVKKKQTQLKSKPEIYVPINNKVRESSFINLSNKLLWLGLFLFGLLMVGGSYLINKYRERKYAKLVSVISRQNPVKSFHVAEAETTLKDETLLQPTATLDTETTVQEHTGQSILQEAKTMMRKGSPEDAIAHLKWAIGAKPKTAINYWLYLLDIFRQQNLKDEFEKLALEMHQQFNMMTPLWEKREVAIVVSQTLEEFPYIVKFLTEKWPSKKLIKYLEKLISDNRSGERTGFSLSVVEEVLLLINVLELREED